MRILGVLICLIIFGFSQVSANYVRNVEDEYKIYQLDIELGEILKKYDNQVKHREQKEKLKKYIAEKIGKTQHQIRLMRRGDNFKNLREYTLYKLYVYLQYGDGIYEGDGFAPGDRIDHVEMLKNDFIQTIGRYPELHIDEKSVYGLYGNNTRRIDYIYFFETNKNQDIGEYISENIFEDKYEGKCDFKEYNGNFIFTDNKVFSFQATQEYAKEFGFKETPDCGEFTHGYFEKKSDNLIIFVKFTYEYVGLDYSLIEAKY